MRRPVSLMRCSGSAVRVAPFNPLKGCLSRAENGTSRYAGKSGTYNFLASPVSVRGGACCAVPEHPIVSFDHDLLSHKSAMRRRRTSRRANRCSRYRRVFWGDFRCACAANFAEAE